MIKKLLLFICFMFAVQIAVAQETASINAEDVLTEEQVSFYPNPVKEDLKITNTSGEQIEFAVFNIMGDEVLKKQITSVETEISLEKIPSGVYIVAFYYGDVTMTERLIKEQ